MQPAQHWESVYFTMERHRSKAGRQGGMSICMDHYCADERLILGAHVVPGHWLLQGGTTGGGGVMRWLEKEFGDWEREEGKRRGVSSLDLMNEEAKVIPAGSDGVVFFRICPENVLRSGIRMRKVFTTDWISAKKKGHLIRAAMEGTAYALKHNLEAAEEAGAKVEVLKAMGGAAKFTPLDTDQIRCDRKNHGSPLIRYCNHIGSGTSCRSRSRNV